MPIVVIEGYARSRTTGTGLLSVLARLDGLGRSATDASAEPLGFYADDYLRPLQQLMPHGALWNRDAGTELTELLRALSYSFLQVGRRALDLLREIDPNQTLELLPDWETAFEIPGSCGTLADTIAGRQADLVAKIRGNDDPAEALFLAVAVAIGYDDATIKTYDPFVAGSPAGAPLCDPDWQFRFEMVRHPGADDGQLACRIDAISPIHTYHSQHASYSIWNSHDDGFSGTILNRCAAFGVGPRWVLAGNTGNIWTSEDLDGLTWIPRTAAGAYGGTFQGAAYDTVNELYCLVGSAAEIQTSSDGIVWSARTPGGAYAGDFYAVAHDGAGLWVAVGSAGGIQTSSDGVTWTARTPDAAYAGIFRAVAYGGGLWVIGGSSGEVQTSPDGINWTRRSPIGTYTQSFQQAVYTTAGNFVLAGDDVGSYEGLFISADGITWVAKNLNVSGTAGFFRLAVSPLDGTIVCANGSARIHSSIDELETLHYRNRTITTGRAEIAVSPDGRFIATGGFDEIWYSGRDLLGPTIT